MNTTNWYITVTVTVVIWCLMIFCRIIKKHLLHKSRIDFFICRGKLGSYSTISHNFIITCHAWHIKAGRTKITHTNFLVDWSQVAHLRVCCVNMEWRKGSRRLYIIWKLSFVYSYWCWNRWTTTMIIVWFGV